jgi:hypothetical protein
VQSLPEKGGFTICKQHKVDADAQRERYLRRKNLIWRREIAPRKVRDYKLTRALSLKEETLCYLIQQLGAKEQPTTSTETSKSRER